MIGLHYLPIAVTPVGSSSMPVQVLMAMVSHSATDSGVQIQMAMVPRISVTHFHLKRANGRIPMAMVLAITRQVFSASCARPSSVSTTEHWASAAQSSMPTMMIWMEWATTRTSVRRLPKVRRSISPAAHKVNSTMTWMELPIRSIVAPARFPARPSMPSVVVKARARPIAMMTGFSTPSMIVRILPQVQRLIRMVALPTSVIVTKTVSVIWPTYVPALQSALRSMAMAASLPE